MYDKIHYKLKKKKRNAGPGKGSGGEGEDRCQGGQGLGPPLLPAAPQPHPTLKAGAVRGGDSLSCAPSAQSAPLAALPCPHPGPGRRAGRRGWRAAPYSPSSGHDPAGIPTWHHPRRSALCITHPGGSVPPPPPRLRPAGPQPKRSAEQLDGGRRGGSSCYPCC